MTDIPRWLELHAHSYFSLLDGSTSPEALVARAQALGMPALALTDHDTLAGAIRFWSAARKAGVKPLIGAELTLTGGAHLTVLAETQQGYANLCALLTRARCDQTHEALREGAPWPGKVAPALSAEQLAEQRDGLIVLTGAGWSPRRCCAVIRLLPRPGPACSPISLARSVW